MSDVQLTKIEAKALTEAARSGNLALPERLTPASRERTLGRFLRLGLVTVSEGGGHTLTRSGYRAIGLEPPRVERAGTKQALVLQLLGRQEGASLAELIAATGWLPHTTRAALSRIRSAGKPLGKSERPDGATAYRIQAVAA